MIRLTSHALLLAQDNRLESLSRGFRDRKLDFNSDNAIRVVLILVASAFVAWLISYLFMGGDRRRRYNSPWRLFFTLCRAHRLRWREWWLLWQIARSQRLSEPACLFLEPQRLAVENLGPALRLRAKTIEQLQQRLFAGQSEKAAATRKGPEAPRQAGPPADQRPATDQAGTPLWQLPGSPALDVPPWANEPNSAAGPPNGSSANQ